MRKMSMSLRVLLMTLLLALTVGLVACGGGDTPADTTPDAQTAEVTHAVTQAATQGEDATVAQDTVAETEVADTQAEEGTEAESEAEATTDATTEAATEEVTEAVTEVATEAVTDVMIGETLDAPYAADFAVSNVFSNDMVVQRGEHIRVWGTAPASENGKKVSGEFKGMFAEALVENGEWVLTFGARMEASTEMGHTMKIYTNAKTVAFTNVLVGDVYMVIGQSNVAYSMANHWTYNNTPDKAGQSVIDGNAPIRIHYNSLTQTLGYPQRGTEEVCTELKNGSRWKTATVSNISNFSAIGYLFAYHMIDLTDNKVPVGIIEIDGNGQPIGAFVPNEVAAEMKTDTFNSAVGYYKTTGVNADWGRYMYNHYMFPFEKYAMAGIVWYQGESDYAVENAKKFADTFTALMTYMRGTHNLVNKNFPVYMIEFPTNYDQHPDFVANPPAEPFWAKMDVGLIRTVLGSIPRQLPNSYLSVSSDLWMDDTFWNTLHPNCKYEQAERCASIAAAVLGKGRLAAATGPILKSIELSADGKTAVLTYDNVGTGLETSDGGKNVIGFALVNSGYRINPTAKLTATITAKDQVTVTGSRAISGLVYNYGYNFVYGEHVNLCNSFGVPAGANMIFSEKAD